MLLIPAIDLRGGRCVRLYQGDFAAETRYDVEPQTLLERYRELGASWLHIVDLDGARDGAGVNRDTILQMAAQQKESLAPRMKKLQLQVGGGLRDANAIESLLNGGVSRAVIGSAAVTQPERVQEWLKRFGADAITLAFDVRVAEDGTPRCATHGWQQQSTVSLWDAVERYLNAGLKHVLCTDVARDGAMTGPNFALYREAAQRYPQIAWQASGGVRDAADLHTLITTGAAAAISGRALLEKHIRPEELRPFLPNA